MEEGPQPYSHFPLKASVVRVSARKPRRSLFNQTWNRERIVYHILFIFPSVINTHFIPALPSSSSSYDADVLPSAAASTSVAARPVVISLEASSGSPPSRCAGALCGSPPLTRLSSPAVRHLPASGENTGATRRGHSTE